MSVSESASELLADALVFEYLRSRGLARTAQVYALETRRKFPALANADSLASQLWVNFRQKLGVNQSLRDSPHEARSDPQSTTDNGARSQQNNVETSRTTLDFVLRRTLRGLSNKNGQPFGSGVNSTNVAGESADVQQNRVAMAAKALSSAKDSEPKTSAKKKKKKQKSRKYHAPPFKHEPGVNHNVQYHKLGKPLYRRTQNSNNGEEYTVKSKESWMPMELRMKMLKRDMELAKHKQQDINDWEYRKQKQRYKTDSHARKKNLHKLTQRSTLSRRMCALCEHDFLDLPFSVSYKAIMDLRRTWGVKVVPESRYLKNTLIPHCYEPVHVCVFCSQFFGIDFFDAGREKAVGV